MGNKNNKGEFKEIKTEDAPEHIQEMLGDTEKPSAEAISGKKRDFVQKQKSYYTSCIGVAILGAELEAFMEQARMKPEERSIKWNGMIMPDKVLKSHTLLKNAKYIEGIHDKHSLKKSLLHDGLTEEQINIIGDEGKYVTELPTKINIGEAGNEINQG